MGGLNMNDPRLRPPEGDEAGRPPQSRGWRVFSSGGRMFVIGAALGFLYFPDHDDPWSTRGRVGLALGAVLFVVGVVRGLLVDDER
jgi:hypothetical protein